MPELYVQNGWKTAKNKKKLKKTDLMYFLLTRPFTEDGSVKTNLSMLSFKLQ